MTVSASVVRLPLSVFLALVLGATAAHAQEVVELAGNENLLDGLAQVDELLALAEWDEEAERYVSSLGDGRRVELTLERTLQRAMERLLRSYNPPYAALVAMDPRDGRLLAMVEHARDEERPQRILKPISPAASVFKVVTGAALLEAGVEPAEQVCYHGGRRRLSERNLQDDPGRDHLCASLSKAMGHSLNVVFAKLATRHLTADALRTVAGRFFFNQPLPVFPPPPTVGDALLSPAVVPDSAEELDFGRTAAGFGEVRLSPLHGAVLASAVGHQGIAVEPRLVAGVQKDGVRIGPPTPLVRRVVDAGVAAHLTRMMERTVSEGTARGSFRERRGPVLGQTRVAGKTGSLFEHNPFRDHSWFVGFAPADAPRIAVSAVVVNGEKWRVKAPYVAREALRTFFDEEKRQQQRAER